MSLETCSFKRSHPPEMGRPESQQLLQGEGQGQDQATHRRSSLIQATASLAVDKKAAPVSWETLE